jgi:hypothetical protein
VAESKTGTVWVAGEVGNAIQVYKLTLADPKAGGNNLTKVQAAYPSYNYSHLYYARRLTQPLMYFLM